MGRRTTLILGLLTALLASYILLFDRRGSSTDEAREEARRAVRFSVDAVSRVSVLLGSQEVCAERTGTVWRLTRPVATRADADAVLSLLDELSLLDRSGVVTARDRKSRKLDLHEYGLDTPRARVRLQVDDRELDILIGNDAPVGAQLFLQLAGSQDIILAPTNILTSLPAGAVAWRDRHLVEGDPASVVRAEVRRADGYLLLSRSEDGWRIQKPVSARANAAAVDAWVQQLFALRVEDFVADSSVASALYGLDEPQAQLTLASRQGGKETTLLIGREAAGSPGLLYVALRDGDHVYAVSNAVLDTLRLPLDRFRDRRLLPWAPDLVRRMEMERGADRVALVSTNGSEWEIAGTPRAPAEAQAVWSVLSAWSGARILQYVDDAQTNLAAFGLQAPLAKVTFAISDGPATNTAATAESITLLLGRVGPTGSVYVLQSGEGSLWRVADEVLDVCRARALDYRRRLALSLDVGEVRSIRWQAGARQSAWEHQGTNGEAWVEAGTQHVDKVSVDAWLRDALAVRVAEWVAESPSDLAAYGLNQPSATITLGLTGESGLAKVLLLGGLAGAGRVFGLIKGQDTVFALGEAERDKLLAPLYKSAQPDAIPADRGDPSPKPGP